MPLVGGLRGMDLGRLPAGLTHDARWRPVLACSGTTLALCCAAATFTSHCQWPLASASGLRQPEPEPEPEGGARHRPAALPRQQLVPEPAGPLLDIAGCELCLKFAGVQPGQCRFGAECHRSHGTPSAASRALIQRLVAAQALAAEAEANARLAEAAAVLNAPLPQWLHDSRTELVFSAERSPHYERMRTAACRFLRAGGERGGEGTGEPGLALDQLHTLPPGQHSQPPACPALAAAYARAGMSLPSSWGGGDDHGGAAPKTRRGKKALKSAQAERQRRFEQSDDYIEYIHAFKALVADVVAPLCGDESGIVFQCPPSLRIHMPGKSPTIGIHCDADYEKHQSAEINFWIPLTDVYGR